MKLDDKLTENVSKADRLLSSADKGQMTDTSHITSRKCESDFKNPLQVI